MNKDAKPVKHVQPEKTAGQQQKAEMLRYDMDFPMEEVAIDLM